MEQVQKTMEDLLAEKKRSTEVAVGLESKRFNVQELITEMNELEQKAQREVGKLDLELDDIVTKQMLTTEKLEEANKIATLSELEVSALVRKVQLLDEETERVTSRLNEVVAKLTHTETAHEDHERARKIGEARSLANEEKIEMQESQCWEANQIAEEAGRKYEEVLRKLKMIENDVERVRDRAEEFESKYKDTLEELDESADKLKKLEEKAVKQAEKEDKLDNKQKALSAKYKEADTRAEFLERTVEKLEDQVDNLMDAILLEKIEYHELSKKLDVTLNGAMEVGTC